MEREIRGNGITATLDVEESGLQWIERFLEYRRQMESNDWLEHVGPYTMDVDGFFRSLIGELRRYRSSSASTTSTSLEIEVHDALRSGRFGEGAPLVERLLAERTTPPRDGQGA